MAIKGKSRYAGIEEIQTERSYLPVGDHVVRLLKMTHETNTKGVEFFGTDVEVLQSTDDTVVIGSTASTYQPRSPKGGDFYIKRDLKSAMLAFGGEGTEVSAETAEDATGEKQTFAGKVGVLRVINDKPNPNTPGAFYKKTLFLSLQECGLDPADYE